MRHVVKGDAPDALENWKARKNENWEPRYLDFRNPEKRETHGWLLDEQGATCCYCGCRIDSDDSHIEHFRPQERYADKDLDYDNLLVSCIRETGPDLPLHCGHAKGGDFNEDLHISPLDPSCTERFVFGLNGSISTTGQEDASAQYMIDLLRLDISFLRNRRAATLAGIFDEDFLSTATEQELVILRRSYLGKIGEGALHEFFHVVARFIDGLLP